MIPGLRHRTTEYKISEDCTFTVHEPDLFCTMDEADEICKNLRKQGYHCGVIYQYRHRGIGKMYIGQTMSPYKRHLTHLASVRNCKINSAWCQALKNMALSGLIIMCLLLFQIGMNCASMNYWTSEKRILSPITILQSDSMVITLRQAALSDRASQLLRKL